MGDVFQQALRNKWIESRAEFDIPRPKPKPKEEPAPDWSAAPREVFDRSGGSWGGFFGNGKERCGVILCKSLSRRIRWIAQL